MYSTINQLIHAILPNLKLIMISASVLCDLISEPVVYFLLRSHFGRYHSQDHSDSLIEHLIDGRIGLSFFQLNLSSTVGHFYYFIETYRDSLITVTFFLIPLISLRNMNRHNFVSGVKCQIQ